MKQFLALLLMSPLLLILAMGMKHLIGSWREVIYIFLFTAFIAFIIGLFATGLAILGGVV